MFVANRNKKIKGIQKKMDYKIKIFAEPTDRKVSRLLSFEKILNQKQNIQITI